MLCVIAQGFLFVCVFLTFLYYILTDGHYELSLYGKVLHKECLKFLFLYLLKNNSI